MTRTLLAALALCAIHTISCAAPDVQNVTIGDFIRTAAPQTGWTASELEAIFAQAKMQPRIIELMDKPGEAMPWYVYRERLVTPDRIAKGIAFMETYSEPLRRAQKQYGVPPEIITAIIGVESKYGAIRGSYRVLDSLTTLSFNYPRRAAFFQKELLSYLIMTKNNHLDPITTTGSYAGAIGWPQFMPSSILKLAVDFDGDGVIDLNNNPVDAIGSVAHYFQANGWEKGGISTTLPSAVGSNLDMQDADGIKEYYHVMNNFNVIKRYNHSNLYAMAVTLLSVKLKQASIHSVPPLRVVNKW
jgi:membrane-bound lytic murein transglycosylase B